MAVIGGISSGIQAINLDGNFWTGKGATTINEMAIASNDDKIYNGDLGGEYFKDNKTLHQFVYDKIGWEPGKYGIDNIDVEGVPIQKKNLKTEYFRSEHDGVLFAERKVTGQIDPIGGLTLRSQISTFKNYSYIYMSPFSSKEAFSATLNHEMIHAYHRLVGLNKKLGASYNNYTERIAHNYSYQYGNRVNAAAMLKRFHYSGPFGGKEFWPPWLIPLPRLKP